MRRNHAGTSITYGYGVTWFRKRQREIQEGLETIGVTFDPGCWSFQFDVEIALAGTPAPSARRGDDA
jgi:hypothetical protein